MSDYINQIQKSALKYVKIHGKGGFGTVWQMKWESPDGPIDVAAKILTRRDRHELNVLSGLQHANIVKLIGVVDEPTDFMLVLELCEGGSLCDYLNIRNRRKLSEKKFFDWAEQATKPLEYLRQGTHMKWIHKDVKSPNYLITLQNTLKLGDFGLTKNIEETIKNATTRATIRWMAPELMEYVLSPKYDIFALAVVLWELWTVLFPWDGFHAKEIKRKVCEQNERLALPKECPEPIKDLLSQCWEKDWTSRPDIHQVLDVITSTARLIQIIHGGVWMELNGEFGLEDGPGKLSMASDMTLSPDGYMVIADDEESKIKIYNLSGEIESNIDTQSKPKQIAVSADSTCFMTDGSSCIVMYELGGVYKGSWESCPDASSPTPELHGLAMDGAGDLLLGDIKNEYIYQHGQDGTHKANIKVNMEPMFIAVTSQGTIVMANLFNDPQIINSDEQVLYTLKHPQALQMNPVFVYFHQGVIFVGNTASDIALCYTESGKYIGSMPIPLKACYPTGGLAMTSDSKTMFVCSRKSFKVLTRPHTQLPE